MDHLTVTGNPVVTTGIEPLVHVRPRSGNRSPVPSIDCDRLDPDAYVTSGGRTLADCAGSGGVARFRAEQVATARSALTQLLTDAQNPQHPDQGHKIFELYDAVRNHLLSTPHRRNRVSDKHRDIAALPVEERVSFLKDACWWLEQQLERLPGVREADLVAFSRMTQSVGSNFDLDDNILFLPTEIVLVHKKTGEERGVSTGVFAEIRAEIGTSGEWKDYTTDARSYRQFRDVDPEIFLEHLKKAIASGRRGPSWDAFVEVCSTEAGAKNCTIITARGHYPESVVRGLEWLRDEGYIRYVPPAENIFAVSTPGLADTLGADAKNPSDGKAKVMTALLDDVQSTAIGPSAVWVKDADGSSKRPMHLWHFSDDDYGTYEKTLQVLGEGVRSGRWPDVKVLVSFTGELEGQPKRTVVLKSDGVTRERTAAEGREDDAVLRKNALPPLALHAPERA